MTLLPKTDVLISLIDREILKLRRDTVEQVKTAHARLGVSLREKVHDLHVYAQAPERTLSEVRQAIAELQPDASIPRFRNQAAEVRYHMTDSARTVRRLLKALFTLDFEGPNGHPLIAAITEMRALYDKRARQLPDSINGSFAPTWAGIIEGPDRARALRGFETAILFQLRKALRNGSIWVPFSLSYRHREQLMIPSKQWRQTKKRHYANLHLPIDPQRYVARYRKRLDEGLEQVAEAVLSHQVDIDKDQLVLDDFEAEPAEPDLETTRDAIFGEIGTVQFPELMMEVDSHTRFSSALLGRDPTSWEELLSVYGALLAHGTDMTPTGMALMIPQIRATAISDAMALLENSAALRLANDSCVAFTRRHPIIKTWGEGTIASADAMSLDATRHLFSARQDYRRGRKAIGIYTHKLDQWPLIYDQPIVLMRRQSGAAIEGMLRQRSSEALERIAVDTHGFTFFGMGFSKGLGFDLCPRLKGIKRQLHVPRGTRVPDILEPVVTRDVSMVNIRAGWDGFVRLMASVDAGTLSAVLALERFGSDSRADPIHKCGTAIGQLFHTLFLCDFVSIDDFRRELLRILDRGEATHRLLRAIYAGNIPAHHGRRQEELFAISGPLTLLSNITIAWMTLHMQQVIDRWKREEGRRIDPELLRHIGPARSEGVNFRGKLDFPVHQYQERLLAKSARRN